MWMSKQLQIFDFALNSTSHVPTDQLLPRNNLESHLLVRHPVHGQLNLSKAALSQRPDDLVGANPLLCLLLRLRLLGRAMRVPSIWTAGAGIGGFVVRATVGRWSEGDLKLAIIVCAVRHHNLYRGERDRGCVLLFCERRGGNR